MKNTSAVAENWRDLMQTGFQRYQQGQLDAAKEAFAAAVAADPTRPEGWLNLGAAQMGTGDHQAAVASLQRASQLNPALMPAQLSLGDVHRMLGNWAEAVAAYRRAVRIQHSPVSLNKLGCALRSLGQPEEAEGLYRDAIRMDPGFATARVNLATVQLELGHLEEAIQQLRELAGTPLPPVERAEVSSAMATLAEFFRLDKPLHRAIADHDPAGLAAALAATPEPLLQVDRPVMETIRRYAESARALRAPEPFKPPALPEDWPLIESLFMIPVIATPAEYRQLRAELRTGKPATGDLLESVSMEAAIRMARTARADLDDPVKAEAQLRCWHGLATCQLPKFRSGHFKVLRNLTMTHPSVRRAEPHLVAGTVRQLFRELLPAQGPGLPRAALALMALVDIHPFEDGNGRIAITLLNRELEWADEMPALFSGELGFKQGLGAAISEVRTNADLSPLVAVIAEAQQLARDFCLVLQNS